MLHLMFADSLPIVQAVAAAKKANKQDKIKNDLLALPSMARIKIRVSAGVFEVSLVRVVEETSSVEVLWDRGIKREFKWGSVVFGTTDGPVHQKPSEPAPDSQRKLPFVLAGCGMTAGANGAQSILSPTQCDSFIEWPSGTHLLLCDCSYSHTSAPIWSAVS